MGLLSRFENTMEDGIEGAAGAVGRSGLSPVQITKKAEKQMKRERIVGAGKQYAPTLYTVLVSPEDDRRLYMYYPTLAGEVETFLLARAREAGYVMDGHPLVRFITDPDLKRGKFDVVAEMVTAAVVEQLRQDEMDRYGINDGRRRPGPAGGGAPAQQPGMQPLQNMQEKARPAGGVGVRSEGGGVVYKSALMEEPALTNTGAREIGRAERAINESVQIERLERDVRHAKRAERALREEGFEPSPEPAIEMPAVSETLPPRTKGAGVNAIFGDPMPDDEADAETVDFSHAGTVSPSMSMSMNVGDDLPEVYLYDEVRDTAYQLTGRPQKIGRESANSIVVPDINISRVHAEIHCEPNGVWVIADLGSTNGLFINGRKVQSAPLRDADMITMGTTTLEFQQLD